MASKPPKLSPVAQQILDYLSRHPDAQDAVEGIAGWWLMEERIRSSIADAQAALDELVAAGLVMKQTAPDGKDSYRISRKGLSEIQRPGQQARASTRGGAPHKST